MLVDQCFTHISTFSRLLFPKLRCVLYLDKYLRSCLEPSEQYLFLVFNIFLICIPNILTFISNFLLLECVLKNNSQHFQNALFNGISELFSENSGVLLSSFWFEMTSNFFLLRGSCYVATVAAFCCWCCCCWCFCWIWCWSTKTCEFFCVLHEFIKSSDHATAVGHSSSLKCFSLPEARNGCPFHSEAGLFIRLAFLLQPNITG